MCDTISCGTHSDSPTDRPGVPQEKRPAFLKGLVSLPLAAVLADPILARAAGQSLKEVTLTTRGGQKAAAFLALPAKTPAPTVLLIHEWWGLNDQIKAVAAELAQQGYMALAVDLYDGKVATTRQKAKTYMKAVDPKAATDTLTSWVQWLRDHDASSGKVGTVGWCFGGGWSLNASLATPVDATVIYYGNVGKGAADLAALKSPVLGHFATLDQWINADMVGGFERAMAEAGKSELTVHWYTAAHAFANPSGGRYDADDAKLAWARTLSFFGQHLG